MKKMIFILFTMLISYSVLYSNEIIRNDSTYWNRIVSSIKGQELLLNLRIRTSDYEGEILVDRFRLFLLYIKEVLPYNKDKSRDNYKNDIFDLLINKKPLILNCKLDSLMKYKVVTVTDSIIMKYKDFELEEVLSKYFEEVDKHFYRFKVSFNNFSKYYALIYYLISKRYLVFVDCSSGILTVIDELNE